MPYTCSSDLPSPLSSVSRTTRTFSEPASLNASVISRVAMVDGASAGRMAIGFRSAISVSDGTARGSARASTAQHPTTTHGHRATRSPSRWKIVATSSRSGGRALRELLNQATFRQCPLSATRSNTDLSAARYLATDS